MICFIKFYIPYEPCLNKKLSLVQMLFWKEANYLWIHQIGTWLNVWDQLKFSPSIKLSLRLPLSEKLLVRFCDASEHAAGHDFLTEHYADTVKVSLKKPHRLHLGLVDSQLMKCQQTYRVTSFWQCTLLSMGLVTTCGESESLELKWLLTKLQPDSFRQKSFYRTDGISGIRQFRSFSFSFSFSFCHMHTGQETIWYCFLISLRHKTTA